MAFIKHGDGKILHVVDTDELTDEQKKSVKKVSSEQKQSIEDDSSNLKKSSN